MTVPRNLLLATSLFALTSCQEDLQPEVDRLNTEISSLEKEIHRERERVRSEQEKSRELNTKFRELESEKRRVENESRGFERELASFQKREAAAMAIEEAKPDRKELQAAAREKVQEDAKARVTIQGDKTSGSGMTINADGKNWIYVSPATLSGNSRIEVTQTSGAPLKKFGSFEILESGSLARLEISEEPEHALSLDGTEDARSSTSLLAVNEAMAISEGRAYSVKPDAMSTDSRTRALAAGTAIFKAESGKLVGLLVPETENEPGLWPNRFRSSRKPTNTCLRLDQKGSWTTVPIGNFLEEARLLAEADRFTRLLASFSVLRPDSGGMNFDVSAGGGMTVKEVFQENQEDKSVRDIEGLSEWLKEKGERASPQDMNKRVSGVYDTIQRSSSRLTKELTGRKFSPYHEAPAANSLKWRKDAEKELARAIDSFSS